MNTPVRLLAAAGACALALGLSACSGKSDDTAAPTPPAASTTTAPATGAPPKSDLGAFTGDWGGRAEGDDYDVLHMSCDAQASCRLSIEGSPGPLTGTVTASGEGSYALDMKATEGTRTMSLVLTPDAGGNGFEAVSPEGKHYTFTKKN